MESMTLQELRAVNSAGGIESVTLKGQGGTFLVEIATRNGSDAILAKARSTEPRRFGNPLAALTLLHGLGITAGQFDASAWNPEENSGGVHRLGRAIALREAHRAAAYNKELWADIQASIDDPRPSIPHAEVMKRMKARLAAQKA